MQITKVDVTPVELRLRHPFPMGKLDAIDHITAVFVRMDTREGLTAWGCAAANPEDGELSGENLLRECMECAALVPDLHPTNVEYSMSELATRTGASPAALCAFDLAFHDLLSLLAGLPLYRILGGYRSRIQTSVTIPIVPLEEAVEMAEERAGHGFRMLKIKGGRDPQEDVRRVQAIHTALPEHILRLDADGGYSVRDALDVARVLDGLLEMLEQPVPAGDLNGLREVKEASPVPVLADQSLKGPASALELAAHRVVDGMSIKLATCGGLRCARQIDAIARAAQMSSMVSCLFEPALLISAGLALALSSPNVHYGDLDGCFDLIDDPSVAGFTLQDGWLAAAEVPGLCYSVNLG